MAMDMYTLYGEAAASFLLHGALAVLVISVLDSNGVSFGDFTFVLLFVLCVAVGSAIINGGLLLTLHQITCGGLKNLTAVLKGAGVSAGISAVMSVLPLYVEPLRLAISQFFMTHRYLATPDLLTAEGLLKETAVKIHEAAQPEGTLEPSVRAPLPGEGVGSLPPVMYALQTIGEIQAASGFFTAFAGAYGMAVGAMWTSQCKP